MPSEKRQRQDEGRLLRLEEQRAATQKVQRKRQFRGIAIILIVIVAIAGVIAIFSADDADDVDTAADGTSTTTTAPPAGDPAIGTTPCPPAEGTAERTTTFESGPDACIDPAGSYTATFTTSKGDFTVELRPDLAPKAVNSFVFLARNHYYDGTVFHRIIPGFVVQGGDPTGGGSGGPGYTFEDELPTEGPPFYDVGSLAMANSGADTNGSQFYVVTGQQGIDLPADYSLFGQVTEGMETVRAIEATGTPEGTPSAATTLESVTITEG